MYASTNGPVKRVYPGMPLLLFSLFPLLTLQLSNQATDLTHDLCRMIPCGHSFCQQCLKLLYKPSTQKLSCPTCLTEHNTQRPLDNNPDFVCEQFTKNFALLALADANEYSREPLLQMKMNLREKSTRRLSTDIDWR